MMDILISYESLLNYFAEIEMLDKEDKLTGKQVINMLRRRLKIMGKYEYKK